ncbi:hypothetical protein KORDIASMS9_02418 [Kordia sp. SMS9]|uniref:hypothetical protein n=1 Tax=Kordia sp. SMS9 TaxID=2282170 RepID=UPI000E0D0842|nr:hypothetical protein [Kordia sp. SMS9]AXG70179.1 hypothetical protein KORDIASMS9_02418 [Kordia sp. SMS9]
MKKTLLKRLFNAKASIAFSMLLGGILLLYACSDDTFNEENLDVNSTENIDIVDENSMKLIVDGKFEKAIADINSIDDELYKYIVVKSSTNEIEAFTTEESFQSFNEYTDIISKINTLKSEAVSNVNEPFISPNDKNSFFTNRSRKGQGNEIGKSTNVNDLSYIFDFNWPNHSDELVAHLEGTVPGPYSWSTPVNYHSIMRIRPQTNPVYDTQYYHFDDVAVVEADNYNSIYHMIIYSDKITVRNLYNSSKYLILTTGANYSGTFYSYTIQNNDHVEIPNISFQSIGIF